MQRSATVGIAIGWRADWHHASGKLAWLEPGKGYGFPVVISNLRDLLVGDDKKL